MKSLTQMGHNNQSQKVRSHDTYIDLMKEHGIPIGNKDIMDCLSESDLSSILEYGKLGQDVRPVYEHYSRVSGSVKEYLGALSVGVEPNDRKLLDLVQSLSHTGIQGEMCIDELKREAAYKYLYSCDKVDEFTSSRLKDVLKEYFVINRINASMISPEELQFWWELIPSDEYRDYGSKKSDVDVYYNTPMSV